MNILVDGIIFQLVNMPSIPIQAGERFSRLWQFILKELVSNKEFNVFLLNRGGAPQIKKISYIDFPSFNGTSLAADSRLIQKFSDHYLIDVFLSTSFTTPLYTPSVYIDNSFIDDSNYYSYFSTELDIAISHALQFVEILPREIPTQKMFGDSFHSKSIVTIFENKDQLETSQFIEIIDGGQFDLAYNESSDCLRENSLYRGLKKSIIDCDIKARNDNIKAFYKEWSRLRLMQIGLDTSCG